MKKIKILVMASLFFAFGSCTHDFEDINKNPNLIDQISPGTLLNEIIYNMAANNLTNHYNINAQLMQVQLSYPQYYGGVQRYEILETTGNSQWNAGYKWAKNIREMLHAAEADQADNYVAIALTLNAWVYSNLTDTFGDIPFTEASQAEEGLLQARYDKQEDIYLQLLEDLARANSLYDHTKTMSYGTDILFANNTRKWQKFTNSLRLRLLLRTSDVRPTSYAEIVSILEDPAGNPIITELSDAAVLLVTGVTPNLSPWSRALDFSNQHSVGEYFINLLNNLEDPRRPIYAGQAVRNTVQIGYKGIPSGYDDTNFDYSPSYMNNQQVVAPMIIPILTLAEVEFIQAEVAQKGHWKDAEMHFQRGIQAAIELWTNEPLSPEYFENEYAQYDGTLERIMLHKYLATYFTDNQQWADYRRTGFPRLPSTESMLNDGVLPSRLLYPDVQKIYNRSNYEVAAAQMEGDEVNSKVWWDVN
jgi:hypothetical protein